MQYAAKGTCTNLAKPTRGSWKRLKNALRYLVGVTKVTLEMQARDDDDTLKVDVHVDSDCAKGLERKLASGEMMINGTVVMHQAHQCRVWV